MAEKEERRIEEIEKLKENADYTSGTAVLPPDLISDVRDTIPPPPPPAPPSPKPEDKSD